MIVIGLDVHKQSVTAVAVDEAGRPLEEKVIRVGGEHRAAIGMSAQNQHDIRHKPILPQKNRAETQHDPFDFGGIVKLSAHRTSSSLTARFESYEAGSRLRLG